MTKQTNATSTKATSKPSKATKPAQATAAPASLFAALLAPAAAPAAPAAPAKPVALRGGLAVAAVVLTGQQYRTAAPHNKAWWEAITQACASGPAPVAALCAAPHNVPSHFVGYAMRRGYLAAAPTA